MDLATVIGLVLTLVLLFGSMIFSAGSLGPYIDIPSVMIVFGGTIGVMMMGFRGDQLKNIAKVFMIAIKPPQINTLDIIKRIVEYSTQARRDGILSLETSLANEESAFLKKGLSMAVDGSEPDTIRELLEIEMEQTASRHKGYQAVFSQVGGFSGAMGMIGTLIGLVAMLLNMSDPSAIGPSMAVALLTTLYGAMIGNIFGGPVANILGIRDEEEALSKTIMLEGIMAIQAGDNPRTLEQKLLSFLPPAERISQFS